MTLGILGLSIVFGHSLETGPGSVLDMVAVLLSVHIHSASAVWIKRIGARLQALETTTGTLLVALPLFALNWILFDGQWPNGETVSGREWLGTGIILTGLACFQWGEHWRRVIRIPSRCGVRMEES